jgi:hypothetical protein
MNKLLFFDQEQVKEFIDSPCIARQILDTAGEILEVSQHERPVLALQETSIY